VADTDPEAANAEANAKANATADAQTNTAANARSDTAAAGVLVARLVLRPAETGLLPARLRHCTVLLRRRPHSRQRVPARLL
jgi:hypothetical protein